MSRTRWLTALIWGIAIALVIWVLRQISWPETWQTLRRLTPAALAFLILLNACILLALTARWRVFVKALAGSAGLLSLLQARIAAFSVSYFTPGPQFGGEPLQVIGLKQQGLSSVEATATVALDKLMELLTNFTVLAVGALALWQVGLADSGHRVWFSLLALCLLALPLVYLVALWRGRLPFSVLFRWWAARQKRGRLKHGLGILAESESLAGSVAHQRPGVVFVGLLWAGVAWVLMLMEFALSARFLGIPLSPVETLAALTAARFAFLLPMPGGLGALASSQVLVFTAMGYDASAAAALVIYIRIRDLTIGLVGLALAGRMMRSGQ